MKHNILAVMIALSVVFALAIPGDAALVEVASGSLTSATGGGLTVSGTNWSGTSGSPSTPKATLGWSVKYDDSTKYWTYN